MVGELLRRPVEIGLRTASIAVRGSLYATERAYAVAGHVVRALVPSQHGAATPRGQSTSDGAAAPDGQTTSSPPPSAPARADRPEPPSRRDPAEPPEPGTAPTEPGPAGVDSEREAEWEPTPTPPAHVSEEPELVEAFAEAGAEDGAGAELRVDEPWEGYGQLTAQDVVARIAAADPEELAAVQLYEATHRKREMVLSAVERALRIATADRSSADETTTKEQ